MQRFLLVIVQVFGLLAVAAPLAAQPAPLFLPSAAASREFLEPSGSRPRARRARLAGMAVDQLERVRQTGGGAVMLNLFNDAAFPAEFSGITETERGYSLAGRVVNDPGSAVVIVVNGDVLVGSVLSSRGTYSIESVGPGLFRVRQLDETTFLPPDPPGGPPDPPEFVPAPAPDLPSTRRDMAYTAQCTDAFWWVSCRSVAGFSNPALTAEGDPFGVPGDVETNGLNGPANAVRLLNETAVLVANYRVSSRSATPLPTSGEPVGAATVTGIRAAVNDVRDRCGLAAASWTDPDIQRNVTPVRAVHITEPRAALAEAYRACRRTLPSWTDPGLGPGTRVKAVHSSELLEAAAALQP